METKNNSEFMSQVDAFSGEMQKFIEKSVSMLDSLMKSVLNAKEQEERK